MNFSTRITAVSNIPSSGFNLRAETFFGCAMISLKLTVNQISSAGISDVRKERVSVIRQN
jgi:hypothetical protein